MEKETKKQKLAKILTERLEELGFISHRYNYDVISDLGAFDIIEEDLNNEDFIDWLLDINEKEISEVVDELNEILK